MRACTEFEDRLLDPDDAEAQAHVNGCSPCADEARSLNQVLRAAVTPAPSAADRVAVGLLPSSTAAVWRMAQRRKVLWQRGWSVALVGSAALCLLLVPGLVRRGADVGRSVPWAEEATSDEGSLIETTGMAFADEEPEGELDDAWSDDFTEGADL